MEFNLFGYLEFLRTTKSVDFTIYFLVEKFLFDIRFSENSSVTHL